MRHRQVGSRVANIGRITVVIKRTIRDNVISNKELDLLAGGFAEGV